MELLARQTARPGEVPRDAECARLDRVPAPLLACPFCRQLFAAQEARRCPDCDVELRPMHELPPSLEAQAEAAARGEQLAAPEYRLLPYTYLGRGRGALLLLAALGLVAFTLPWVEMTRPDALVLSGFDLARARTPYLWPGAAGNFLLLPLLWTRRTLAGLHGVRHISTLMAALSGFGVLLLLVLTPGPAARPHVAIEWRWGLWLSLALSVAASAIAVRLGGSLRTIEALPWTSADAREETSSGEILH